MFEKSKITQAMIDAVNSVLGVKVEEKNITQESDSQRVPMAPATESVNLSEASLKVPTKTGMKVYGSSYGNSAKAHKDQTRSAVDDIKEPTKKDIEKDSSLYRKTPAISKNYLKPATQAYFSRTGESTKNEEVEVQEELKGNQHKIDANHNGEVDAQDFKILRGKKKVKEGREFTEKLLETVRKSDVPAYLRKAKGDTPLTVADVKAPKKDSISAPENLAKARNEWKEEIEHLDEDNLDSIAKKHGMDLKRTTYGAGMKHPTHGEVSINRYGEWNHYPAGSKSSKAHGNSTGNFASLDKHLSSLKEEVELTEEQLDEMINEVLSKDASAGDWIHDFVHSDNPKFAGKSTAERKKMALGAYYGAQKEAYEPSDAPITTDTLAGRLPGGKSNSFKPYKLRVRPLDKEGEQKPGVDVPKEMQPQDTPARRSHEVHEATIAGTPGWEKIEKNIKDKSGAIHTPMSRAKDLARAAFKDIQSKTKVK